LKELNIAHTLRDAIVTEIEEDNIETGLFNDAQAEIFDLMHNNLWLKFQESNMFATWKSKRDMKSRRMSIKL
jgi:hypothetical protein